MKFARSTISLQRSFSSAGSLAGGSEGGVAGLMGPLAGFAGFMGPLEGFAGRSGPLPGELGGGAGVEADASGFTGTWGCDPSGLGTPFMAASPLMLTPDGVTEMGENPEIPETPVV